MQAHGQAGLTLVISQALRPTMTGELHLITSRALLSALPDGLWCHKDVLLALLLGRKGEWVSTEAIINELWWYRTDGGPVCASGMIKVCVHRLRKSGWNIKTWSKQGYCLIGRSLIAPAHSACPPMSSINTRTDVAGPEYRAM